MLPQLRGLGRSAMAQRYGLDGLAEAQAFLADPLLRQRLEKLIGVIHEQLQQPDQSLERLMGGELDTTKTISSLTLFEAAGLASATAMAATPITELLQLPLGERVALAIACWTAWMRWAAQIHIRPDRRIARCRQPLSDLP